MVQLAMNKSLSQALPVVYPGSHQWEMWNSIGGVKKS